MSTSETYLFKNCVEYVPLARIKQEIPSSTRGVYVLYNSPDGKEMNVVYIGMSRGIKFGIGNRLQRHVKSKSGEWTHFSAYEVWDNITKSQVEELEGLFLHVYARDKNGQLLGVHKASGLLRRIRRKPGQWLTTSFADGSKSSQTLTAPGVSKKPGRTRRSIGALHQKVKKL
jgi:hypothetical protein